MKVIFEKLKEMQFSLQIKLILVFSITTLIVFALNIYMLTNINRVMWQVDAVFVSNTKLNDLQIALKAVQSSMTKYLSNKNSDTMEEYFRSEQIYYDYIKNLNEYIVDDEELLLEKNIKNMSERYLSLTNKAIEAKRSRNISKYNLLHEEASKIYSYIDSYIYNLNNIQFKNNSNRYKNLISTLEYSGIINITIMAITALLNIILIITLVNDITKPLKQLAKAANQVASGQLDADYVEVTSKDEVGVVSNAFNEMVENLRLNIDKLKDSMEHQMALKEKEMMMESLLKDVKIKYLQAQINPHFLFNTLNAGAQLAMMENADRTYEYVQNVADFFRYNVKKNHDTVTLKEELELVDHYLYILNVRFSGEIVYKKEIDESLTFVKIPSMTLQPIIENAINHGIQNIDWEAEIKISVFKNDDKVCVSVSDNGIGMSEEMIDLVSNNKLKSADVSKDSNGVGLNNVITRLKLFYDKDDIFKITSKGKNLGTTMTIFIPIK